ncbi:alpha/beta fold hydrolase [Lysobacter terrae]
MTALIVLPGLDGTATLHAEFLSACDAFESAVAIPYPTHRPLGYRELEVLVRAELPTSDPFVLLGESFSGPIALSIAANPPANLVGVVLSTTFVASPFRPLAPLAPLLRLVPVRSVPLAVLSWLLLGRWATRELQASLQSALQSVSPDVLNFRAETALRASIPNAGTIAVPTLCLRATDDRLLPASAGERIRSAIAGCEVVQITGPHLLLQAAPVECARVVSEFFRPSSGR